MTKRKDESETPAEKQVPVCKRCKKPINNPSGDNGCGTRTENEKTVTNCVPEEALSS